MLKTSIYLHDMSLKSYKIICTYPSYNVILHSCLFWQRENRILLAAIPTYNNQLSDLNPQKLPLPNHNLYHCLGWFNRRHIIYIFLFSYFFFFFFFFFRKQDLTFHANCLHLHERTNPLSGKNKKSIWKCRLLKIYPECWALTYWCHFVDNHKYRWVGEINIIEFPGHGQIQFIAAYSLILICLYNLVRVKTRLFFFFFFFFAIG